MVCTATSNNQKNHTRDIQEALSYLTEYMNSLYILVKIMLLI